MAAMLTSLLYKPHVSPAFSSVEPPLQPFKFSIFVAGFKAKDPRYAELFPKTPIVARTLHVLGKADVIVGEGDHSHWEVQSLLTYRTADRTLPLVEAFADSRTEWHDGTSDGYELKCKAKRLL